MRNLKRALSLAVASVMLLGMMVVGSSAASYTDVAATDHVEAIEVLKALKIMEGDENGNFNPSANVTRNDMAVIMCHMLGLTAGGTSPFSDVPDWAQGYVAACYSNGILAGIGNGLYGGSNSVTAVEAGLMLMKPLGYFGYQGEFGDSWKLAVVKRANQIGLYDGISAYTDQVMTRNEIAQMVLNALENDVVTVYESNSMKVEGNGITVTAQATYDVTPIADSSKNYDTDGRTSGINWAINGYTLSGQVLQLAEKLYGDKIHKVTTGIYNDYQVPAVEWYYPSMSTTDKIGKFVKTSRVLKTWTTGVEDITLGTLYSELGSTGALDVYENGSNAANTFFDNITPTRGSSYKPFRVYRGATILAIDDGGNGRADHIAIEYPLLAKVTKVTEATGSAERKITMKVWNKTDGSTTTGVTYITKDFAKDDYVLVYFSKTIAGALGDTAANLSQSSIIEIKAAEKVTGTISALDGANGTAFTGTNDYTSGVKSLTVSGTKYPVAGHSGALIAPAAETGITVGTPAEKVNLANMGVSTGRTAAESSYGFKSSYTLFLSNGYIMGVDGKAGAANMENVVYITGAPFTAYDSWGGSANKVQVVYMDGTSEVLTNDYNDDGNSDNQAVGGATITAGFYTKTACVNSNNKYMFTRLVTTNGAVNNTTDWFGAQKFSAATQLKTDSKSLAATVNATGYITDSTRLLYIKDSGSDLKVTVGTMPARIVLTTNDYIVFSDDNGNPVIEAIVVVGRNKGAAEDAVFYLDGTVRGSNDLGYTYRLYSLETGEYELITSTASNVSGKTNGFVTYSVNDKGVYSFTGVLAPGANDDDGQYVFSDAALTPASAGKYGSYKNTVQVVGGNGGYNIADLDATNAVIINLDTNTGRDGSLSLSDLDTAAGDPSTRGAGNALRGVAYVYNEKVVALVVTLYNP